MSLSGKSQLSPINPIDFIGDFFLGDNIGGAVYSETIPLYQYVFIFIIGVLLISSLNLLATKVNFFRNIAMGNS
ncbi:hypothetical protein MASR2M36_20290 [Providencia sp.]